MKELPASRNPPHTPFGPGPRPSGKKRQIIWRFFNDRRREWEAAVLPNGGFLPSNLAEQLELRQGGHAIIEADLLDDFAALNLEDGGAGEMHFPACVGRQAADEEVGEG